MDFVAITWTRPVPWAGFTNLPRDAGEAAKASLTIRYQRALIARHVAERNGQIVHELTLFELAPDRSSVEAMAPLRKLVAEAGSSLRYVFVDFAAVAGSRRHRPLIDALAGMKFDALFPDEIMLDGKLFDPIAHFRDWSQRDSVRRLAARTLPAQVQAVIKTVTGSLGDKARALNAAKLTTSTGKAWTAENLRKFLAKYS